MGCGASKDSASKDSASKDDVHWRNRGGDEFEAALTLIKELGDSAVRLVDALYLIELAEKGGKLRRRQDLPAKAFITLPQLKAMNYGTGGALRVVVVSYPWLQPDHPDPRGDTLWLLACVLRAYIAHAGGTCGVFLDFCSLMQKGPNGKERTPAQAKLFGLALSNLSDWYSHSHTLVLKLTKMPEGYPNGFTFVEGTTPNTADYYGRGWCFKESSVANLVKDYSLCLDLGKLGDDTDTTSNRFNWSNINEQCRAGRAPPMTPEDFATELEHKSFTSKKADLPTVGGLYRAAYTKRFAAATELDYEFLGWGDTEVISLCRVLESGGLSNLKFIGLGRNTIGDAGMTALASALGSVALPKLKWLDIDAPSAELIAICSSRSIKLNSKDNGVMRICDKLGWTLQEDFERVVASSDEYAAMVADESHS